MGKWQVLVVLSLVGCSGPLSQTCPDGEPVNILKKARKIRSELISRALSGFCTGRLCKVLLPSGRMERPRRIVLPWFPLPAVLSRMAQSRPLNQAQ